MDHQNDRYPEEYWDKSLGTIDATIEAAILSYVRDHNLRPSDIGDGCAQVEKLASDEDPDYGLAGIPVGYAFKYQPRRVSAVVGAMTLLDSSRTVAVSNILDV